MKPIRFLFLLILLSVCISGSWAQSNDIIDSLMEMDEARYGEAVYLALTASDYISERASIRMAMSALHYQGWKLKEREADESISLGEFSYILMKAFNLKGGMFYAMFPTPRYAARELKYLGFIRGFASPNRKLDGHEAIKILGKLMRSREVGE